MGPRGHMDLVHNPSTPSNLSHSRVIQRPQLDRGKGWQQAAAGRPEGGGARRSSPEFVQKPLRGTIFDTVFTKTERAARATHPGGRAKPRRTGDGSATVMWWRDRSAATRARCGGRSLTKPSRTCAVCSNNLRHVVNLASFDLVGSGGELRLELAMADDAWAKEDAREREKKPRASGWSWVARASFL